MLSQYRINGKVRVTFIHRATSATGHPALNVAHEKRNGWDDARKESLTHYQQALSYYSHTHAHHF